MLVPGHDFDFERRQHGAADDNRCQGGRRTGSTAAAAACAALLWCAGTAAGVRAVVAVSDGVFTSGGVSSTGSDSDELAQGAGGNQKSRSLIRTRINAASSRASAMSICRRCFCSESSPTEGAYRYCNSFSSSNGMTRRPPARGGDGPAA